MGGHLRDSRFLLDTKYDLIKFISERKDTFVHLVPYTDGERRLTRAEEYSIAKRFARYKLLNT